MVPKAVSDKTIVVPSYDGWETEVSEKSTILTWMTSSGTQVPGSAALIHLTKYCLPQAAPLSHIPSPAAANRLLDGNCPGSYP